MNLEYRTHTSDDCIYLISLYEEADKKTKATPVNGIVTYTDECVLEIHKLSGARELVYSGTPRRFRYERVGNEIRICANIPLQRLWICKQNNKSVRYKVPVDLPLDPSGKWRVMRLPKMKKWQQMAFCADPYFEKVFPIHPED